MRKFIDLAALLLVLAVPAAAQSTPQAEVFGGFSTYIDNSHTLHGWNVSANGNINDFLGIKGDFSGFYSTQQGLRVRLHTFTFGPQFSYRKNKRLVPFAHALFGGARASAGFEGIGPVVTTAFTTLGGAQTSVSFGGAVGPVVAAAFDALGGAQTSVSFGDLSYSNSSFAMNFGGGLDWVVHKNIAIRVIQTDVLVTYFGHDAATDGRISAGIVFRFGSK